MTFLKQTLTLSTVGASLITSNSFWFFDFFGLQPILNDSAPEQLGDSTPNPAQISQTSSRKTTVNINGFSSALRHPDIKGKSLKNAKLKIESVVSDIGINITLENQSGTKYMNKISSKLEDFTLTLFQATEQKYLDFSKESIKISLFTNPAWYSSNGEDEYSTELNKKQIEELFNNQDEAKVKQLLLSLHKRLEWKKYGENEEGQPPTRFTSNLAYPTSLDDLKNLKIKYFDNFDPLKEYVHKKVSGCVGEVACIADLGELDVMDTDLPTFFEKTKSA